MPQANIMQLFAGELGGTYDAFVQGSGFAQLPPDLKGGYCEGASIMWLSMLRGGMDLVSELKRNAQATSQYISKIQRVGDRLASAGFSASQPTISKNLETTLSNAGFRKAGTAMPQFPFDSLARYIYNHGSGGYYLIQVSEHALAAYGDSNGLRFFDANAGQVLFHTFDAFELFISRYFCHRDTMALYDLGLTAQCMLAYRLFG